MGLPGQEATEANESRSTQSEVAELLHRHRTFPPAPLMEVEAGFQGLETPPEKAFN